MKNYVSFHGTDKFIADNKIKFSPSNIVIPVYTNELEKGMNSKSQKRNTKPKLPGSLGYGFYTFIYTKDITEKFISRQSKEYTIIKVYSIFEDNEILDFNLQEVREKFHVFRSEFIKYANNILKAFGNPSNNYKQHVMDGLIIETFIAKLLQKENKKIAAVIAWTFTPCDEQSESVKFVSFIPNSLELCIRDRNKIQSLEKENDNYGS